MEHIKIQPALRIKVESVISKHVELSVRLRTINGWMYYTVFLDEGCSVEHNDDGKDNHIPDIPGVIEGFTAIPKEFDKWIEKHG